MSFGSSYGPLVWASSLFKSALNYGPVFGRWFIRCSNGFIRIPNSGPTLYHNIYCNIPYYKIPYYHIPYYTKQGPILGDYRIYLVKSCQDPLQVFSS